MIFHAVHSEAHIIVKYILNCLSIYALVIWTYAIDISGTGSMVVDFLSARKEQKMTKYSKREDTVDTKNSIFRVYNMISSSLRIK